MITKKHYLYRWTLIFIYCLFFPVTLILYTHSIYVMYTILYCYICHAVLHVYSIFSFIMYSGAADERRSAVSAAAMYFVCTIWSGREEDLPIRISTILYTAARECSVCHVIAPITQYVTRAASRRIPTPSPLWSAP